MRHALFVVLAFLCISHLSTAQIVSTFDVDNENWTFTDVNLTDPQTVNFNGTGGNPGGYASATKTSTSLSYFWNSPAKFSGNISGLSYGQDLVFDLQVSYTGANTHSGSGDVQLRNSTGSLLVYTLPSFPAQAPAWSTFTIRLDETANWRVGGTSGPLATQAQMLQYLATLSNIRINGNYRTGVTSFTSGIDNVRVNQRSLVLPTITQVTPLSGKVGTTVTITGSNFDATPTNNVVYFGGVKAAITAASTTSLTVTVPAGAQYASILVINKTLGFSAQSTKPFTPTFDGGGRIVPASFDPKEDITLASAYGGHSLADMDGDGWNDLVVAREDNTGIWVYRNLGAGGNLSAASFAAPVSFATGLSSTNGSGVAVADFDNDGKLDMVTSGWTGGPGAFATFRNVSTVGNLAFETVELWNGRSDESPVYFASDIDGDGFPELVSAEGSGGAGQNVWITQNLSKPGNILFGYSLLYFDPAIDDAAESASLGDLNGDNKPEFILVAGFGGNFSVITNTSTPGSISFGTTFTVTAGVDGSVRVADFNQDGKNDLAWKNGFSADDVHIRLNANNGGTLLASDFATEVLLDGDVTTYGSLTLGDLNGDGKVDLLANDNGDMGAFENVFSGGAFNASAFVPSYRFQGSGGSTYPGGMSAADLNGDEKPDIVAGVTNISPARIILYENKNTHAPAIAVNTVYPLSGPVGSTVTITGDYFSSVTTDNKVWFGAVAATVVTATKTQLTVSVPAGAGYGFVRVSKDGFSSQYRLPFKTTFSPGVNFDNTHFAAPVSFTLTGADYDLDVADLNQDNKPDVLAEAGGIGYVFRNVHSTGAITVSSLVASDTLGPGAQLFGNPRIADFDEDSKPDILSVNTRVRQNITASANIDYTANITFPTSGNVTFADFNNDGKKDVAIAVSSGGQLSLVENRTVPGSFTTGTYGSFSSVFTFTRPAAGGDLVSGDFDGDGNEDVITTNPATDNISIFRNLGTPRINTSMFATRVDVTVGDNPARILAADLDVDGKQDILVYHGTGTSTTLLIVFQNTSTSGNISFTRIDLTNPSATTAGHIADLDGDGKPEILTTSEAANRFTIFKNVHITGALATGSFATPFNTTVTAPRGIATADINLDGKSEILITRAAGVLLVYQNLIINSSINITTQPATGTTVCEGVAATLTTAATGVGTSGIVYRWQKYNTVTTAFDYITDGAQYTGTNSATLNVTTSPAVSGVYRAEISDLYVSPQYTTSATFTVLAAPTAPTTTGALSCTPASVTLSASGASNGSYRWFTSTIGTAITGEVNSTYTTPVLSGSRNYYVAIDNGTCQSSRAIVTATIGPAAPTTTDANICGSGAATLTAAGGSAGQYRWYTAPTGGSALAGETNNQYTTISISTSTPYYVSIDDGTCESPRALVTANVNPFPSKPVIQASGATTFCLGNSVDLSLPLSTAYAWSGGQTTQQITITTTTTLTATVTNSAGCVSVASDPLTVTVNPLPTQPAITASGALTFCEGNSVNLSAPAGFSYLWSTGATTQQITATTAGNYTVTVTDANSCSSPLSAAAVITTNAVPAKPTISVSGTTTLCGNSTVTLSAPAGFASYVWSNGATTSQITVSTAGSFTVQTTSNAGCTSVASDAVTVTVTDCNRPPVFETVTTETAVNGNITIDLVALLSDPDNNIDLTSLKVIGEALSGADASINSSFELVLDYQGISFSGTDEIRIEVCDAGGACVQQVIKVDVVGDLIVLNGVSPNGDNLNDFLQIRYIDLLPDTRENRVTIYNRWGDEVFAVTNYDNKTNVFRGQNKNGNDLPSGTYLYKIEFKNNRPNQTGYLVIKR